MIGADERLRKPISPARMRLVKEAIQAQEQYLKKLERIRSEWKRIIEEEDRNSGQRTEVSALERKYLFEYGDLGTL
jgi:hypothetical protein